VIKHEIVQTSRDKEIKEAFLGWAETIADRSHGFLQTFDMNDANIAAIHADYTDLSTSFYEATEDSLTPQGHEEIKHQLIRSNDRMLAPGEFGRLSEALRDNPEFQKALELMESGENVVFASDHNWFTNIAVLQAAIYNAADKPGLAQDLCLTISKTLGFLDVVIERDEQGEPSLLRPAISTSIPFTNTTCSIPPTASLDKPQLQPLRDFRYDYNSGASFPLIRWARRGGRGLTTAPSASLDETDVQNKTITMKRTPEMFVGMLHRYFPNALPVATTLQPNGRIGFEIGELRQLQQPDDVHVMMEWIAQAYRGQLPEDWRVVYQTEEVTSL
jgi:hypothetical protein